MAIFNSYVKLPEGSYHGFYTSTNIPGGGSTSTLLAFVQEQPILVLKKRHLSLKNGSLTAQQPNPVCVPALVLICLFSYIFIYIYRYIYILLLSSLIIIIIINYYYSYIHTIIYIHILIWLPSVLRKTRISWHPPVNNRVFNLKSSWSFGGNPLHILGICKARGLDASQRNVLEGRPPGCSWGMSPWFGVLSERSYPIIDLFFQKPQTEFLKGRILVKFCKWLKYEVDYDWTCWSFFGG